MPRIERRPLGIYAELRAYQLVDVGHAGGGGRPWIHVRIDGTADHPVILVCTCSPSADYCRGPVLDLRPDQVPAVARLLRKLAHRDAAELVERAAALLDEDEGRQW